MVVTPLEKWCVQVTKLNKNQLPFYMPTTEYLKKEMKKNLISKSIKKNKIVSNTFNQRGERSVHRKL